jgi:geranylgeranyl reductase family protein
MDSCGILIVGGGPAGSSCAWALRSSGLDVMVLDKSAFPRDKICGGWITPSVLKELEIDPENYARGRVMQPITGFRVSCMGQQEIDVPYRETVSYGIRRCEFDEYLLRRSGARIREGVPVQTVKRTHDGWIINDEISARLLVGAGGHFCPIAKAMGNTNAEGPVVAQEIEFEMTPGQAASCKFRGEVPELYFCRDLQGYGWCFRKGNFLNIGLGRLDQHTLSQHVKEFVEWLRSAGKLAIDLPRRLSGHAYLLFGYSKRKVADDAVMLIGDSAGLAYPQSGEGIRPAIESGLLAAQVIASAQGSYDHDHLQPYSDLLQQRFGAKGSSSTSLGNLLPRSLRNSLGRMLLKNRSFCRRVVVDNWFLHSTTRPLEMNAALGS